jgi:hypothetical protein
LNSDRHQYEVSKIDDCLVKNGPRADYLVSKVGVASAIIELKGTDVAHACDQLFASVVHANVVPLIEGSYGFLIVCRRYPRFDSFVAKAKDNASKRYKAGFHVVAKNLEFDIERVVAIDGPF